MNEDLRQQITPTIKSIEAIPIAKIKGISRASINWQPLIDASSTWLNSKTFTALAITVFLVLMFGAERVAGWFEAVGYETLSRVFGSGGN